MPDPTVSDIKISMGDLVALAREKLEESDRKLADLRLKRAEVNTLIRQISAEREQALRIVRAAEPRKRAPKAKAKARPEPVVIAPDQPEVVTPGNLTASSVDIAETPAAFRPQ